MKKVIVDGHYYKLPNKLNKFQQEMYVHLINWKWQHITHEPGVFRDTYYDAILPYRYTSEYPMLYPEIREAFKQHLQKLPFRVHSFFNHMASSQAANINLFLPTLLHPQANAILGMVKPDLASIAQSNLDNGYQIEFWDDPFGNLGDKAKVSGTDSDLAIAYYNHQDQLCLWLIEHKLTEKEFTDCGGYKSRGRKARHDCTKSFAELLSDKGSCYYHDVRKFNYWNITEANQTFFQNSSQHISCPFRGGLNQLWRNQLLALSIEQDKRQPYQKVDFSVVIHPRNTSLQKSIGLYKDLISNNAKFSVFTSADLINAARDHADDRLERWIEWYTGFYHL
jgi:hypothetical protein